MARDPQVFIGGCGLWQDQRIEQGLHGLFERENLPIIVILRFGGQASSAIGELTGERIVGRVWRCMKWQRGAQSKAKGRSSEGGCVLSSLFVRLLCHGLCLSLNQSRSCA